MSTSSLEVLKNPWFPPDATFELPCEHQQFVSVSMLRCLGTMLDGTGSTLTQVRHRVSESRKTWDAFEEWLSTHPYLRTAALPCFRIWSAHRFFMERAAGNCRRASAGKWRCQSSVT